MFTRPTLPKLAMTVAAAVALVAAPAVRPANAASAPSYATHVASDDDTIKGVVTAFDGHYALTVRDDRGFLDHVQLHQGTIINPTGLMLASGETVTVIGANGGDRLLANEIDTPYTPVVDVPTYGYGYGYGYPSYGVGFDGGFGFGFRHFRR